MGLDRLRGRLGKTTTEFTLDSKALKSSPLDYAELLSVKHLEELVSLLKDRYYNRSPLVSDSVFDAVEDVLRRRYSRSKVLRQTGAVPKKGNKVKLPIPMPSLDKVKPNDGTLEKWLARHGDSNLVLSDKIDGVSVLVVCENGEYTMYTRGDGEWGQDISAMQGVVKLPKTSKSFIIRGELVIDAAKFKSTYGDKFKNPRNFVSGVVNRQANSKRPERNAEHVHLLVFEWIKPAAKQSDGLRKAKALGFIVVPHQIVEDVDASYLVAYLKERKRKSKYDIDGIVVTEDIRAKPTRSNPTHAIAFKTTLDESVKKARVVNVEYRPSKHGYLIPRVEIKPIDLQGVTIRYATGHNFAYIRDNGIGPGAEIKITRSGEVIPYIVSVSRKVEPQLPDEIYKTTKSGVHAVLLDTSKIPAVTVQRIAAFLKKMEVEFVSPKSVEKIVAHGYDTISKVIHAKSRDWRQIPGLAGDRIITSIKDRIWDNPVPVDKLMAASGMFGRGFGERVSAVIVSNWPDIMQTAKDYTARSLEDWVETLEGFSSSRAKAVRQEHS